MIVSRFLKGGAGAPIVRRRESPNDGVYCSRVQQDLI